MTKREIFEVSDFSFQRGGFLPSVKMAYRTIGTLNSAKDNAVLIPSWYTGTDESSEHYMCGPGRALDPNKYFIILANLLGNGVSSSPSNTPSPHDRARFPKVTYWDNVTLQHQLITLRLGIKSLRLVTGWSMGASQAFLWASRFPDMVKAAAPIAGSARTAAYNKVFLLSLQRTLKLDPSYRKGFYNEPLIDGLKAFASIYAGWGFSEAFFRTESYRVFGAKNYEEFVEYFWEPFFTSCDPNDLLSQLWTWADGDISDNTIYNGNFEAALGAIKARTTILPVDLDRYFPPVDAEYEAAHIPNGKCHILNSIWGHMEPMNLSDTGVLDRALTDLLK